MIDELFEAIQAFLNTEREAHEQAFEKLEALFFDDWWGESMPPSEYEIELALDEGFIDEEEAQWLSAQVQAYWTAYRRRNP